MTIYKHFCLGFLFLLQASRSSCGSAYLWGIQGDEENVGEGCTVVSYRINLLRCTNGR